MKSYRFTTDEGLEVKVDLLQKGIEDDAVVEDWEINITPSPGYRVDDCDVSQAWSRPGLLLRTSREER
ncbi:MAG: hypothetical protein ACXABY_23020 [Candidatus Thorarchaeota archaeon]|jgi:hypothetical protein